MNYIQINNNIQSRTIYSTNVKNTLIDMKYNIYGNFKNTRYDKMVINYLMDSIICMILLKLKTEIKQQKIVIERIFKVQETSGRKKNLLKELLIKVLF